MFRQLPGQITEIGRNTTILVILTLKIVIFSRFTFSNRSETNKNGFYVENWDKKLYFADVLTYILGLEDVVNKMPGGGCIDNF